MRWLLWLAVLGMLAPGVAWGQGAQKITTCGTASPPAGNSPVYMDADGNLCIAGTVTGSFSSVPSITTYQGTLAVTTSAAISTLTLSNGTAFPTGAMGVVFILNSGSGTAYICWFGGTCAAGSGSFPLVAGASVSKNLGLATTVPTAFSTAGTTLAITN
jgi:hypothetical protein